MNLKQLINKILRKQQAPARVMPAPVVPRIPRPQRIK